MVSAILNYQVDRPLTAIYSVEKYQAYVMINAQAVVKSVVGTNTYNEQILANMRMNLFSID